MPVDRVSTLSRQGYRVNVVNEFARVREMLDGSQEPNVALMRRVVAKVKGYLDKILELDEKILASLANDEDALTNEVSARQTYNDQQIEQLLILEQMLEAAEQASVRQSAAQATSTGAPGGSPANPPTLAPKVHLPKLEIPVFKGDYLQWQEFWDLFAATVHGDRQLTKVQKFSYLRTFLDGEALAVVQGYQLSEANYDEVVNVLTERFGDKQRAKFGHFEALVAIKPASLESRDLVRMYYESERHIRSLVALGVSENEFSIAFVPTILAKLPAEVKREVWAMNGDAEWTMANLRTCMKAAITARERGDTSFAGFVDFESNKSQSKHNGHNHKNQQWSSKGSASMLVTNSHFKGKQSAMRCSFCQEAHGSDKCQKFPDLNSRRSWIQKHRRCFICLGEGHEKAACRNVHRCVHCGASNHHRSICFRLWNRMSKSNDTQSAHSSAQRLPQSGNRRSTPGTALLNPEAQMFVPSCPQVADSDAITAVAVSHGQNSVNPNPGLEVAFLPTAVTTFYDESQTKRVEGRVLMDTASSRSYITEDLCRKLKLPILEESFLSIGRFGSNKRVTTCTKRVKLYVACRDGSVLPLVANVTSVISSPVTRYPIDQSRFPIFRELPLAEPLTGKPDELHLDVLIGSDYYYQFVTPQATIQCEQGPVLVGSKFGFLTAGTMQVADTSGPESTLVLLLLTESASGDVRQGDPYDRYGIERFWQMEDVGTKAKGEVMDVSDEQALTNFYNTLKFENGRYWVTWPFKSANPELADNRKLAYARLKTVLGRLEKDPKLLEAYDAIIQEQIRAGVVEVAPETPDGPVYYVPHHEVITPSKTTTKIRIVYDASSKSKKSDLSLNECMHRGLVILDDLCGLLMRFRTWKIAVVSDIEKAFLQIGLQTTERDVGRFFWLKDFRKGMTPDNLIVLRFTRVFFGAIASPSLLGSTLDAHAQWTESHATDPQVREMARIFRSNRYSDNVLAGGNDVQTTAQFYREAKKMCQEASMNLREFYTNSQEVRDCIAAEDRGMSNQPKVLGIKWTLETDSLSCCGLKSSALPVDVVPTKRTVVREVAQIYDPCGWVSPVSVLGKLFIQELWKQGIAWDEAISTEMAHKWLKVRAELNDIPKIEIPRYVGETNARNQLHVFCDASQKVAAAAVYWRKETAQGVSCDLVFAKNRLAPLKKKDSVDTEVTIPKLELVAVELGVNLLRMVERELRLPIDRQVVWSDSQVTLLWIRKERLTGQFVRNRVNAIREYPKASFRYVPTMQNPADIPSRGTSVSTLKESTKWWHGPEFLLRDESQWPKEPVDGTKGVAQEPDLNTTALTSDNAEKGLAVLISVGNYSSLHKLLRVTCYVRRAVHNFRNSAAERRTGPVRLEELAEAQTLWEKEAQRSAFPEWCTGEKSLKQTDSKLKQLKVYRDSTGLLRCDGRLHRSELPTDAKSPILLPKEHAFTHLVIEFAHRSQKHAGVAQTLAQVRLRYWVIHGRSTVKKVLRKCPTCTRVEGGAYRVPLPPDLPDIRVTENAPFAYTGLDYLGPLSIKVERQSVQGQKVWICLFTCALTRAVHLEVVENQSAQEFHLALRRFFALYGTPLVVVSDNASQFRTVDDAMSRLAKATEQSTEEFLTSYDVEWRNIPEVAPWMGGFYERMVGTVKRFLKKALDGIHAELGELRTVVAEIANIVNSRPLLYVEDDVRQYTLCPRDFLGRVRRSGFPSYDANRTKVPNSTVGEVMACWKRLQALSESFWTMWREAYLTSLREKYSNAVQRAPTHRIPTVDSVVQIKDKMPRGQWKLGRVMRLVASNDGKIRSAVLRLANHRTITRPLRMLYPLEMGSEVVGRATSEQSKDDEGRPNFDLNTSFYGFSQRGMQPAIRGIARVDRQIQDEPLDD